MSRKFIEPDGSGKFPPQVVTTGQMHTFVLRRLELEHRYHDDSPVQGAAFTATFPNGLEARGTLDSEGRASLLGVPDGTAEVRYGPDVREYTVVDDTANPDYRPELSPQDIDALVDKYRR